MAADEKRIRSLEDLLAEEGLVPLARAVDLIGQIAAVVDVAAANGWAVDRIEPATIQVTADGPGGGTATTSRTKVVGLISATDLPVRPGGPRASYLAPEVSRGAPEAARTAAAHQFSLAAIAYEMLAGCPAFPEEIGDNREVDRAFAAIRNSPPPVSEMVLGAAAGLDAIFERALSTDPARRFGRIDDFVSALREVSDPGSVWDDGATVIWSPAAGDMEPPPLSPRITPPAIRRVSAVHAAVRTQSAKFADAARQMRSAASAWTEQWRARRHLAHMRKVEADPPPRPPTTDVSDSGSLPPPLALASFPAPAIPSRRTQVSFLAAAVMLVLGAVVVMSAARVRPSVDANNTESAGAGAPMSEPIRPRSRAEMARPPGARPQLQSAPAAPTTVAPTSQRRSSSAGSAATTVTVAASAARPTPATKAARRHSRKATGARVASNSRH